MNTVKERPSKPAAIPLLVDGQRLGQAEFMRRYELTPPGFKAELIGGVVYVACPLARAHGFSSADVIGWLVTYRARTPGTEALADATTVMDDLGVPQPDAQLRILPECGGQSRNEGQYVGGAPELVVEIARSTRSFDLGAKRDDYDRAGVREYLVVALDPDEVHWYHRRAKKLVRMRRDRDGIYRSKAFPGLWLDPIALLNGDIAAVFAALDRGLASPEHAAFVAKLAEAKSRRSGGE